MFTKVCLISILALLVALLINQHSQDVVHAQAPIEYKAVQVEISIGRDWRDSLIGANPKYYSTQDALNEYGKNGWQLVTASYYNNRNGERIGQLIFLRK
jgi:hypothetical protein